MTLCIVQSTQFSDAAAHAAATTRVRNRRGGELRTIAKKSILTIISETQKASMRPVKIAPPAAAAGSHTPTMPQSGNSNRAPRFSGAGRRSHHIALILYGAHDAHDIVGSDAASTSAGLALGHSPPPAPDPGAGERPVPAASPYHAPSPYPSTFSYAVSRPAALSPLLLRPLRGLLPLAAHEALSNYRCSGSWLPPAHHVQPSFSSSCVAEGGGADMDRCIVRYSTF